MKEKKTWIFKNKPAILSTATVGGPFEKKSPFAGEFDSFKDSLWMEQISFEKANRVLIEETVEQLLMKAKIDLKKD